MRQNRVPPTALAVLDQRRMCSPTLVEPPSDQKHVTEHLVFPGADDNAMVSAIEVFIVQGVVDQQFDPITHRELLITTTEHLARAGLGITASAVAGPSPISIKAIHLWQGLAERSKAAGPDLVEFPPTGQQVFAVDIPGFKAMDAQFLHAMAGMNAAVAQVCRITTRDLSRVVVVPESFPGHGHAIPSTGVGAEDHATGTAKQFRTPMILDRSGSTRIVHEQSHPITGTELAIALAELLV